MSDTKPRPLEFADLLTHRRARPPVASPCGRWVVFAAVQPDRESNKNHSHLYRVPAEGGDAVKLTTQGTSNSDPVFSPDGKWIAFTSNRGKGAPQIWLLPTGGGEARQVTKLKLGATRPVWFPDGERLLAISPVYVDSNDQKEIEKREEKIEKDGAGPRVIDALMFRHWDHWTEGKIDHLFSVDVATGEAVDLTPGPYPVPPRSLTGDPDYAVSPDGREVCFVSLRDEAQAVSTNANLWVIPAAGGEPKRVSPGKGLNAHPVYSPDGTSIAYVAMARAGYEADRQELMVMDRASGTVRGVCPDFDRSVGAVRWSPDGKGIFFSAQDQGCTRVYRVAVAGGTPEPLTGGATDGRPAISPDGSWLAFARESLFSPPEIHRVSVSGGDAMPLSRLNREPLAALRMHDGEDFWFEGAKGARVHGVIVKPPQFEKGKKYPVVFLIHGGPQSMFGRDFHERWNVQLFAAQGYVAVTINPRGSTGYGQDFTDAINGQWGGDCYQDLVRGFDYVLDTFDFCDRKRTAAAGASFGGFMANWIAGQTDRFRCLVSHDGILNTEMMNWSTDELWFTEWEFGGLPWEKPEAYRQYSPHRFIENMKTPMLLIQGEQDFRCPVSESLPLFTALQRKGVPSRLLYLPDEGHWVLKPKNREVWWATVLDWLGRYLKG